MKVRARVGGRTGGFGPEPSGLAIPGASLVKTDHARPIDRQIDYFGGSSPCRPERVRPVGEVRLETLTEEGPPWARRAAGLRGGGQ